MKNIQDRLIFIRGGQSRRSFADALGITESTLRNYERGSSLPSSDLIAKICADMHVSTDWLIFGSGPMRPDDEGSPSGGVNLRERISELEKELAEAREAERKALWEAARAYKLATENMRAMTDTIQEPPDFMPGGEATGAVQNQKPQPGRRQDESEVKKA